VADLLNPAIKAKKSAIERHHLFPKGYLQQLGITDIRDVNQIANYALVEWADNLDISDKAPSDYFPTFYDRYSDADWRKLRFQHGLPKGWEKMTYSDFLNKRRKLMADVVRAGYDKLS
jgi:hypothetical protein